MSKNMTKKRMSAKKKKALQHKKLLQHYAFLATMIVVCLGAFAGMNVMNSRNEIGEQSTEWYVMDGEMEILAAPMANTMERRTDGAMTTLPFLQATQAPTAVPTQASTVEPAATPEGITFATPTPEPMATLEPEAKLGYSTVKITAVGDCTLGGNIPTSGQLRFASYYEKYGPDYFFEKVRYLFENDDLTIVNLEGPLTTSNDMRENRKFNFRGLPEYVSVLSGSSVEIANVANNHTFDYGQQGLYETAFVLENENIGCSGFGREYYTEVNGVTVGSLGFTEWEFSQKEIQNAVFEAKKKCDLLLVSIHWGTERQYSATETQKKLGRAIIDAGADIVIGNHTHVYGGVDLYKGKYIIYSLGNFCFGGNSNPEDKDCLIFQQTFKVAADGTVSDGGISIIPARVSTQNNKNNYQPYVLGAEMGEALLRKVAKVSNADTSGAIWMEEGYQGSAMQTLNLG